MLVIVLINDDYPHWSAAQNRQAAAESQFQSHEPAEIGLDREADFHRLRQVYSRTHNLTA